MNRTLSLIHDLFRRQILHLIRFQTALHGKLCDLFIILCCNDLNRIFLRCLRQIVHDLVIRHRRIATVSIRAHTLQIDLVSVDLCFQHINTALIVIL